MRERAWIGHHGFVVQDPKILGKTARLESTYDRLRFKSIAGLEMELAETRTHYRKPPVNGELDWKPVTAGHNWGDNWMTGWFRGMATIPSDYHNQKLFLRAQTGGPETMLIVNGKPYGVFDENHPVRMLALEASGEYQIHLESYAGHTFPGTQPFSGIRSLDGPVALTNGSLTFGSVELMVERPVVSEFVHSLRTLVQLNKTLDENSLRRGRLTAGLGKVFAVVPQKPEETTEDVWLPALSDALEIMRPLLDQKNGPSTPTMTIFGHSHIDTAWLWPLAETWRKCARTYSSVLALMDEYPEFRFMQSAAVHFEKTQELYPELFERVREKVKEGRWEINGAMWLEPDCNIPSGESFVRQCLYGQRAYQRMFGVKTDTLWQPDVFGYSAALPQILQKAGVQFFCTTKLSWNDTNRFPYDTFHWQGIDGTTVLAHFNEMQGLPYPEQLANLWKNVQHTDVQDRRMVGFGHGDGGGGPMNEMIESVRRTQDLEGCPKTEYGTVSGFMNGCLSELTDLPTWVGELYLELHRGTLTSIAAIKRWNRVLEFALGDAELLSTLAFLQRSATYPRAEFDSVWRKLMLNQFHDILPGSAIAEVNDEAISTYKEASVMASALKDRALSALLDTEGQRLAIVNSLSWTRDGEIVLTGVPDGMKPVGTVAHQIEDVHGGKRIAISGLCLPSLGIEVVDLEPIGQAALSPFKVTDGKIETPFAILEIDADGAITSFFDKASRRQLVKPGSSLNHLLIGEDVPAAWDNWDIDRDQRHKLMAIGAPVCHKVVADGPLQFRIRQEFKLGASSSLKQDIVFHSTTPRIDFETVVDWHEKYQFLKVGFGLDVLAETALHEIQFGHVQRNSHDNTSRDRAQFDVCAHKWTDISEGGFGVAFLNDCKYACTIKEGEYRLSLIKSGRHPDPRGDEGEHRFTYSMLPHQGGFSVESVVRPAYELNVAPISRLCNSVSGSSLLSIDAPNVIVAAVKMAEDSDDLIVRLYEAGKTGVHAKIRFGFAVAAVWEVDLLETDSTEVEVSGDSVEVYFRPFEIKTLKVTST